MPHTVRLARYAMATRFEVVLHGARPTHLQAAGEEALDEIERVEQQISIYRPDSQISRANHQASRRAVKLEPTLFELVEHCLDLSRMTEGTFDITIAPLVKCWGFMDGSGRMPEPDAIASAKALVGVDHIRLDRTAFTIEYDREGVMLDFGSVGKGFALDRAVDVLKDNKIRSGIIHGGTSTVVALGSPPDRDHWKVAIGGAEPARSSTAASLHTPSRPDSSQDILGVTVMKDESLSISAVWGKRFQTQNRVYGHVLDGRTGYPVQEASLASILLPSATDADALSTALLAGGPGIIPAVQTYAPDSKGLIVLATGRVEDRHHIFGGLTLVTQ